MRTASIAQANNTDRWALVNIWGMEVSTLLLRRLEPDEVAEHWRDGISADVIDFIVKHCRCTNCQSSILAPLAPCSCGEPRKWDGFDLSVSYPRVEHEQHVHRLFARQTSRNSKARRKAVGGTIAPKEMEVLFAAQDGICYYCAAALVDASGGRNYHCDHFVPVALGGRGDLENSVLACVRCNLLKSSSHGDSFVRTAVKLRFISEPQKLQQMRRSLGRWRRAQGFRPLRGLA